ncbi:MAG TPA: ABC transporter substrate-binding protein [Gemmatimonadaceae bacterium]|nr:ABC transporter substrate-binding protein [Gemmatimonadaceae bacterium]
MTSMKFAVLGPVEVERDDEPLPLGGPKQRSLLAILLLNANKVVSRDRLIDGLWGERPPPGARTTIESYISRLRRLLGADRIAQRSGGYVLRVEPGEFDLERFETLARSGEYAAALANWRGPALADLLFEPFAAGEAERLEELRLAVVENWVDAKLAEGVGNEVVAELQEFVRRFPAREQLVAQLMQALYQAGRQADALAAYRAARTYLSEELGLEPGPRLKELERRVLAQDPELRATAPRLVRPGSVLRRPRRSLLLVGVVVVAGAALAGGLAARNRSGTGLPSDESDRLVSISPTSGRVAAGVELPASPAALTAAGALWLADPDNGRVDRIDAKTGAIVAPIPVGGQPASIVSGGGAIWVAGAVSRSVSRIDPATDTVTQKIRLAGGKTSALAFGRGALWVADQVDHALIEIDPSTGSPEQTFTVDVQPTGLAVGEQAIWVADSEADVVAEVDATTGQTLETIPVGNGPSALALGGGILWVANSLDATVTAIDTEDAKVVATIPVGSGPTSLAYVRAAVWVANQYSGTVSRIDRRAMRVTKNVHLGGEPTTLAAAHNTLWVGEAPDAAEHRGGTLRLVSSRRFSVDPAIQFDSSFEFSRLAYDSLVTYEAAPGADGLRLVPDLAVAIPSPTAGGTVYTFRLRTGIRYSDGRLVRASDFRRAIERQFLVPGAPVRDYFRGIVGAVHCTQKRCDLSAGVRADDAAGTVTFRLTAPDPDFLAKLTVEGFSAPIPPGIPNHDVGNHPVPATGPYMVASVTRQVIRLVRNPYFREWSHVAQPAGNPDVIVWRFVDSDPAATRSVEQGSADWTLSVAPSQLPRLRVQVPGQLHENPGSVVEFVPLNTHESPFDDERVRQAFNFAIDRKLIARLYGGEPFATPTCQPLSPGLPGFRRYCPYTADPRRNGVWSAPDLAKARRLVAASGTRGDRITVWASPDEGIVPVSVSAYLVRVLRSLGYRTRLHLVPYQSITPAIRRRIQLSVDGDWLPDYPTPTSYLPGFFSCDGALSNGYVCDPKLDRAMSEASLLEIRDPRQASVSWTHIDHLLTDRAYWLPTVNIGISELVTKRVRNYEFQPAYGGFIADQAWLK